MGFETIHETQISVITDILKDGSKIAKDTILPKSGVGYAGSIAKATRGLVMEFPVLVSKANHIESAGIVAKAYEAKFVTMLQLAFTACNITNAKDGFEYIRNFHTNLNDKALSVDEFIDILDGFAESANLNADSYAKYKAVTDDMRNLCFYFDEDIKESSLDSYKVFKDYSGYRVIKEEESPEGDIVKSELEKLKLNAAQNKQESDDKYKERDYFLKKAQMQHQRTKDTLDRRDKEKQREIDKQKFDYQKGVDDKELKLKMDKDARDAAKQQMDMMKTSQDIIQNYLVSSEIKKANELVPTMMIINFVVDKDGDHIRQQQIIGVKAKLYEVEPTDVINKIITKHVDNNVLLKFIKASTREISFVKDFLLAIDDAKLTALSKSRRGSTNKLFKVLERRALGGKIRKSLRAKDYAKAISSLVISQEEAEALLKNNIDVNNPSVIRPIMEQLNLISFAIIDESSESVRFIFDSGDDVYETIPFSKLEKEQRDGMSRKVINLISKMNR